MFPLELMFPLAVIAAACKFVPTNNFLAILAPPSTLNIPVSPLAFVASVVPTKSRNPPILVLPSIVVFPSLSIVTPVAPVPPPILISAAEIVPLELMFPLEVMLVVVILVKLAEGEDKNTSAVRVWPSIVEPDILLVVVNDCKVMSSSCFN